MNWAESNHQRYKDAECSHLKAEPMTITEKSLNCDGTIAARSNHAARYRAERLVIEELKHVLYLRHINRWYRRLWRYLQAMWWSLRMEIDHLAEKIGPAP